MHIHARLLHRLLQLGNELERVRNVPATVNEVDGALDLRQGLDRVRLPVDEEVDRDGAEVVEVFERPVLQCLWVYSGREAGAMLERLSD